VALEQGALPGSIIRLTINNNCLQRENHGVGTTNPMGISMESADMSLWKSESRVATERMLRSPEPSARPAAGIRKSESANELATARTQIIYAQGKSSASL
jgi:hypothetical protein